MKRLTILAAAAVWLAGCTWTVDMRSNEEDTGGEAPDPFFLEAELFYPERVALPGNAEMLVAVDAVGPGGRTTLTRFSTRLEGHQVPIPLGFSVEPESESPVLYELSAAILSGKRLLRLTGPILVLPREGSARTGRIHLRHPLETGFGQGWQCGSTALMFGAVGEQVYLAVDRRLHAVEQVPAASGVRFQSLSDSDIGVHEKEGEMLLVRGEETSSGCRPLEALEPPLSGGGNEPGWHIDIGEQRVELTSDYGETFTEAKLIRTGSSGRTTRFRGIGEHDPILAAFSRTVCRDSATGMPHPYAVAVQFEDGTLNGCGGRPRSLLVDTEWQVVRLGEDPVPDIAKDEEQIEITMQFDAEGRVNGRAACNQYAAGYELSGEGLSIDEATATMMACAEPRRSLERRFLNLLAEIQRFDIGQQGELVLIGPGEHITAVAQGLEPPSPSTTGYHIGFQSY